LEDRLEFSVADVIHLDAPLPKSDLVTALGVIEYFDAPAMSAFLGNLQTEYLLPGFSRYRPPQAIPHLAAAPGLHPGQQTARRVPVPLEEFAPWLSLSAYKDIWVVAA
jgi:hypothetical protein